MSTKIKRIIAGTIGICMIIVLLLFVNSFTGNPISKALAKGVAVKHVEKNYPNLKLGVTDNFYNFKNSHYAVKFQSHTSEDTVFEVYVNQFGQFKLDTYETQVVNKSAAYHRLDRELTHMTREILKYNLDYDFDGVGLSFINTNDYSMLELDMELDIANPPLPTVIEAVIFDTDASYERIAVIAKDIEQKMKEQRIPIDYYSIRIIPQENKPKSSNEAYSWNDTVSITLFPATLMSEPELAKVMEQYNQNGG